MRQFILVLEEDDEMQNVLVETLEDEGFWAHGVASTEAALKLCRWTKVDLAVSSLDSVSRFGLATYRAIQERYPEASFILFCPPDAAARIDLPGLNIGGILTTPFRLRNFVKTIRRNSNWRLSFKRHLTEGIAQVKGSLRSFP